MEEFFGRYRNLSVLLAVVFAQIILLGYQVRTARGSRLLREWTVGAVMPLTTGVRGLTQWAGSTWEHYFWLVGTRQENDSLRGQLARLKLENVDLRTNLERFEREEKLIAYQKELASRTILAEVVGKGANSNSKEIFISRGHDDGVTAGMPVITPDGIVGKVQASYAAASLVMLINDPEAGVGVLLSRSRAAGILKGTGRPQCRVDYVSHEVNVAIGETVYTSGDDRVFPKGLRIGEVTNLGQGTDFQEISVKPFASLDRLEEVLVIISGVHQDLPDSPQAQPPQFLMPLPPAANDQLRAEMGSSSQQQEPAAAVQGGDAAEQEHGARVTDADRLRQYYQSIAAQQGHRFGDGGPGSPAPDFNSERLRAAHRGEAAATPEQPARPQAGDGTPPEPRESAEAPGAAEARGGAGHPGTAPSPKPRDAQSPPAAPLERKVPPRLAGGSGATPAQQP